jgi:alkylation response protein AidB-like acyl-CoA dehydrogenase
MSMAQVAADLQPGLPDLDAVLACIAAGAGARDEAGRPGAGAPGVGADLFPVSAIAALEDAGALRWNAEIEPAHPDRPPAELELALVRRVARADGSVGRIFDGHLNAVERLAVQAPTALRDRELGSVLARELRAGVWGGDPLPGEGPPAAVVGADGHEVLRGVKTFCSGAGGLHRALVLARDQTGADAAPGPVSVWVDLTDSRRVEIDTGWYRSHGLVASVSHRVVFHDTPVLARLGANGAISQQPWFGRDALRTAASWAGMADTAVDGATAALRERPAPGDLEGLAMGRMLTAQRTIDVWLAAAARAMDEAGPDLAAVALHGRVAIAEACRSLLDEAARACGSRPFVTAGALDRSRRDLEVFLLQHRLDPLLARAGSAALQDDG